MTHLADLVTVDVPRRHMFQSLFEVDKAVAAAQAMSAFQRSHGLAPVDVVAPDALALLPMLVDELHPSVGPTVRMPLSMVARFAEQMDAFHAAYTALLDDMARCPGAAPSLDDLDPASPRHAVVAQAAAVRQEGVFRRLYGRAFGMIQLQRD